MSNTLFKTAAALLLLTAPASWAAAQDYPSRPVSLVVPFPAGGALDNTARQFAEHLSQTWQQNVVVENRPGASGMIGAAAVARAEPDGHTLLITAPTVTTFDVFHKQPTVNVLEDLTAVSMMVDKGYVVLASTALPIKTLDEFIEHARAHPGQLNYGTFGGGNFLNIEQFKQLADLDIVPIQYKGEAPALVSLVANEIQLLFGSWITTQPLVEAGRVRTIAVTSRERDPNHPDLPAIAEKYPGYNAGVWYGVMAPADTPKPVVDQVAAEVAAFVQRPDIRAQVEAVDYQPKGTSPAEFADFINDEVQRWRQVAARADIVPQ